MANTMIKVFLKPSRDETLSEEKIMFHRIDSTKVEIEEDDLAKAIELLSLDRDPTSFDGGLVVDPFVEAHPDSREDASEVGLKRVAYKIAQDFGVPVTYYNAHNSRHPSEEDLAVSDWGLVLVSWGLPRALMEHNRLGHLSSTIELSGYSMGMSTGQRDCFHPRDVDNFVEEAEALGYRVFCLDGGAPYAVTKDNVIWVLFDLPHGYTTISDGDSLADSFLPFLVEPISSLSIEMSSVGLESLKEELQRLEVEQQRKTLERWGEICCRRHDERVKRTEEAIHKAEEEASELQERLVSTLRSLPELRAIYTMAKEVVPDKESFNVEFEKVLQNPLVRSIDIPEDGEIVIHTAPVWMDGDKGIRASSNTDAKDEFAGKMIKLGAYVITLNMEGRISIKNKTNAKDGWQHPHIENDSRPCLGSIGSTLPKLIAKYEIGDAIHLITEFLKVCDADDAWGSRISMWKDSAISKEDFKEAKAA